MLNRAVHVSVERVSVAADGSVEIVGLRAEGPDPDAVVSVLEGAFSHLTVSVTSLAAAGAAAVVAVSSTGGGADSGQAPLPEAGYSPVPAEDLDGSPGRPVMNVTPVHPSADPRYTTGDYLQGPGVRPLGA